MRLGRACAPFKLCEQRLRLGPAQQQTLLRHVASLPMEEGRGASRTAPTLALATTLDTTLSLATSFTIKPTSFAATLPFVRCGHPSALLDAVDQLASAEHVRGASRASRACRRRACR